VVGVTSEFDHKAACFTFDALEKVIIQAVAEDELEVAAEYVDTLQDDIFRAKSDLEDALAGAGDGDGEAPDDGCGASVQHEHEAVDVPLDEDPAAEGGEQQ